jgi:hypothetical protein
MTKRAGCLTNDRTPTPRKDKRQSADATPRPAGAAPYTLRPDPANPNRMAPEDKARMVKSLAEFGECGDLS